MTATVIHGCAIDVLRTLPDNSVDAIVTDPPYGLAFMNKHWDYDVPSVELWREALRVLKPGGHLLSFGGTRTYHRMVVNIEDAGFEIRDQIQWIYGSGFPKSLDVSKAIDKAAGADREAVGHKGGRYAYGFSDTTGAPMGNISPRENSPTNKAASGVITAPATDAARQWEGWGTALKPANEPICLARKPFTGTVAANVQQWGTGALNVDGCRIGTTVETWPTSRSFRPGISSGYTAGITKGETQGTGNAPAGRWPANVLFDDEAAAVLDGANPMRRLASMGFNGSDGQTECDAPRGKDTGGASRFFYVAKASKRERNAGCEGMEKKDAPGSKRSAPAEGRESALGAPRENHHPTVKPVQLMRYLVRLVTPPGGTVLDPFTGSGTTGVAAKAEGFRFLGIEREEEYVAIARARIAS